MFNVYYSNQLDAQLDILVELFKINQLNDPFIPEVVLTQSAGMSKWLKMQLAEKQEIAANINCLLPAEFFWQQYRLNNQEILENNLFSKDSMIWLLMKIIPTVIYEPQFGRLAEYLSTQYSQDKLFQLAEQIADLYDQYLIYRPNWLIDWEHNVNQSEDIFKTNENLVEDVIWQTELWKLLCNNITQLAPQQKHRATLHYEYIDAKKIQPVTNN